MTHALLSPAAAGPAINDAEFDALMPEPQIVSITGGYRQPSKQLAELQRQGFFRARISTLTGKVVLEREHYVAVCRGVTSPETTRPRPKVRPIKSGS